MTVRYTSEARADLIEIGAWIAEDSPRRSETFVQELMAACNALSEMPRRFQLVPGHKESGIRRRPYGNYLIFYWIHEDTVEILHILHGARDYEKIVFPADS